MPLPGGSMQAEAAPFVQQKMAEGLDALVDNDVTRYLAEKRAQLAKEKNPDIPAPVIRGRLDGQKDDDEHAAAAAGGDSDDDLLNDEDPILERLREARLDEMRREMNKKTQLMQKGHGEYSEISEQDFLPKVTGSFWVICHFYHCEFERCKIVDKHLNILARKHVEPLFIKLNAEKSPFFVGKLQVRMLPTIVIFKDGVAVDRVVGFDELGARDDFDTVVMERRLAKGCEGVKLPEKKKAARVEKKIYGRKDESSDSD
eukprot:tig00020603_g11763.t1